MTAPEIRIAPARPADVPLVHAMISELADHLQLAHELIATPSDLHEALFGPRPQAEVLLAFVDGEAAGFALFYGNYSTFRGRCGIHLEDLYVRSAFRGAGLGRRLLAELAHLTIARGCRRLEWWVLAEDADAVAFYDRMGAVAKDEWTVFRLSGEPLRALAAETAA